MKRTFLGVLSAAIISSGTFSAGATVAAPQKVRAAGTRTTAVNSIVGNTSETVFTSKVNLAGGIDSRLSMKSAYRAAAAAVSPPYTATFDTDLDGFTVIDANDDSTKWKHTVNSNNGCAVVGYSSVDADDWLISVPVKLQAGVEYEISIDAKGYSKSFTESLEVKVGADATAEAMTTEVIPVVNINAQDFQTYKGIFTAPADGTYYFGIHGVSKKGQFGLLVDNFSVKGGSAPVEAAVPPFSATFDTDLEGFSVIDANADGITWKYNLSSGNGEAKVACSSKLATDDWLVTPPLKLQAGKTYGISVDAKGYSKSYPESFEVKAGTAATVEGLTEIVIEPVTFNSQTYTTYTGEFTAPADGNYYFGIHGISKRDQFALLVDNFSITAPEAAAIPAAVTDLTAVAGYEGGFTATVTFITPDKTDAGGTLESLSKVELLRDGTLVKTFENPEPGAELSYTDFLEAEGEYTYTVTPYCAEEAGLSASTKVYVGFDLPASVQNVRFAETAKDGEVTISWDPVVTDCNGNTIPADKVTYNVYIAGNDDLVGIAQGVNGTEYTYQAVSEGTQKFVQYVVFPQTSKGEGNGNSTQFGPVGTPYHSYAISNDADLDQYILGVDFSGGLTAGIYADNDFAELSSVEGDDFYLGFYGTMLNQYGSVFTGKISLEGMKNPALVYYTYNLGLSDDVPDTNEIAATVTDVLTGESKLAATTVVSSTGDIDTWNRVQIDLSAWTGKVITITLTVTVKAASYTFIDAISVSSLVSHDIEASAVTVPESVRAGESFTAGVLVKNIGAETADSYKTTLYVDGEVFGTQEGTALASGQAATVNFTIDTTPVAIEPIRISATVEYGADEVPVNNTTAEVFVEILKSDLPAVTDLTGSPESDGIHLTWTEPDLESAPAERITDSFEDGDAFTSEYGDWTFVDVDGSPVGGISTHDIPCITPGTTTGSFWIWDSTLLNDRMTGARTGSKFLFSMFRYDDGTADDWAISPELDGSAQEIVFFAKSYTSTYRERIEIYVSTGSTSPEDFELLVPVQVVMPYWEEYRIEVPKGTRHFAIRSCATAGYMLSIDDVTFTPAGNANLDLVGYNVYRDGVKINEEPVEETEYVDATAENGRTCTYVVTTVYTKGESAASNSVDVTSTTSGVDAALATSVTVRAAAKAIEISGANGMLAEIFNADGSKAYSGICEANTSVAVRAGVWLVKVGEKVSKVIVR